MLFRTEQFMKMQEYLHQTCTLWGLCLPEILKITPPCLILCFLLLNRLIYLSILNPQFQILLTRYKNEVANMKPGSGSITCKVLTIYMTNGWIHIVTVKN